MFFPPESSLGIFGLFLAGFFLLDLPSKSSSGVQHCLKGLCWSMSSCGVVDSAMGYHIKDADC